MAANYIACLYTKCQRGQSRQRERVIRLTFYEAARCFAYTRAAIHVNVYVTGLTIAKYRQISFPSV